MSVTPGEVLRSAPGGWVQLATGVLEPFDTAPPPPPPGDPYAPTILGRIPGGTLVTGEVVNEGSGGADSLNFPDTWYTMEDSGSTAIYALGYDGDPTPDDDVPLRKAWNLTGVQVTAGQWEDMTYDRYNGRRKLWVFNSGGTGTSKAVHSFKGFHFDEPTSLANPGVVGTIAVDTYWFEYPGTEAYDCETGACDPVTGRVYFVTKEPVGVAQLYAAPEVLVKRTAGGSQVNRLQRVTTGDWTKTGNLTGGDFTPDGTRFYCANNNDRGFVYDVVRDASDTITDMVFVEEFYLPQPQAANGATPTAETLFVRELTDGSLRLIRNSEGGRTQIISLEV